MYPRVLVVIPARGDSKGVPRKNLRSLQGRPLIFYPIHAALNSEFEPVVVVSTEDEEVALLAERFGAQIVKRPPELSREETTLDPVVHHAWQETERSSDQTFDFVVVLQPMAPLVAPAQVDLAIGRLMEGEADTVLSVTDDRQLRWHETDGKLKPAYEARVNRKFLPPVFRETGTVVGCRREQIERGSFIGENVEPLILPEEASVEIRTSLGFRLCESILSQKKVVINVIGRKDVGLGHVYRGLLLGGDLVSHEVVFLCQEEDDFAQREISARNYELIVCPNGKRLEATLAAEPDLVINDILDTTGSYIHAMKKAGLKVVNFEDMGEGAKMADLVFNALYPYPVTDPHVFGGPAYFCLRDEFLNVPHEKPRTAGEPPRVLITFGGVDPANLSVRLLRLLQPLLQENAITADIVLGPGYPNREALEDMLTSSGLTNAEIVSNTTQISRYMARADLAITSGGRTVFELASLHVPTLVICQNQRETTHTYASEENGIINLGLHVNVADDEISGTIDRLLNEPGLRDTLKERVKALNLRSGRKNVNRMISDLLNHNEIRDRALVS
ncbi:cytidylyltransferase domain-containing protein [Parvibaculum sp. MBR-TMA-1.3b-4.2]